MQSEKGAARASHYQNEESNYDEEEEQMAPAFSNSKLSRSFSENVVLAKPRTRKRSILKKRGNITILKAPQSLADPYQTLEANTTKTDFISESPKTMVKAAKGLLDLKQSGILKNKRMSVLEKYSKKEHRSIESPSAVYQNSPNHN